MKKTNLLFIIGMVLAWAAFFNLSKWGVVYTSSPFVGGMLLRIGAFIVLTVYIIIKGEFKELFKTKNSWIWLLCIGSLGFLLDGFANIGFKHSSVATGTILLKLDVLMANAMSAYILKDKLYKGDWLCSLIMVVGVIFVLDIDYKNLYFNWYDIFFILSALSVTLNAFVIKRTQEKYKVKNSVIAYYNNFVVMIMFMITAFITKDMWNLASVELNSNFYLLVMAGGLAQSLIYIFYYYNLARYPVWLVKIFLLFIPIVSSIFGIFAFGEVINLSKIIGTILVLSGAFGIIMLQRKKNINKIKNS